jgi:hypothetical protein
MAFTIDATQYTLVPYTTYMTLGEKLNALLRGETLLIRKFERREGADVLIRIVEKKFTVTQISYDMTENELDPRHWITYNIGINDLSLLPTFKFEEGVFSHTNKFGINDVVIYSSEDGFADSAIIEEVYRHNTDPDLYAYKLSRDPIGLYAEEDLTPSI